MFAVHSLEGWLINMSNPYKTRAGGATVTVFVPYDCNNHCPFCINKQEYEDCTGFSLEAILRSIRTMDEITPACDFVFTGGEPLANLDALQQMLDAIPPTHKIYINTTFPVQQQHSAEEMIAFTEKNKDMIGTKYLAEGNFGEAARWQKDVSLKFINNQAISFYAEKRSYTVPYWFNHQKVNDSNMWSIQGSYAHLKENPKWKFCQEMNQLISQYNVAREGEVREKLAYELATRYYQASCYGDCWYLTHYGKSVADSARTGEADFAAIAQKYLKVSKQSSNLTLRYHSLYALSSIGIDPWFKITYDANWKEQKLLQPQSAQYQAMMEWSKFCHQHPEIVDQYTTRCDVLKQFEKNL